MRHGDETGSGRQSRDESRERGVRDREIDSTANSEAGSTGAAGTSIPIDTSDVTSGMGAGAGDDDGMGGGGDLDAAMTRGQAGGTGTGQRAGLGGPSSRSDTDPQIGSGMPNPADMGDQG